MVKPAADPDERAHQDAERMRKACERIRLEVELARWEEIRRREGSGQPDPGGLY